MIQSSHSLIELDEVDRAILRALQSDGRISHAELARIINLSAPAIHGRIRRLEQQAVILRYVALLDREKVGYDMLCLINVSMELHQRHHIEELRSAIRAMPEVLECYHVTGEYDYLLKVAVRSRKELERFAVERLTSIPGIARIRTSLVLSEIKATTLLSLK